MKKLFNLDGRFVKTLETIINLILINALFIIFSLPIFTIGASLTAMYTLSLRIVRKEHQFVWKSFIQAFKSNFKQSTIIWLAFLISGLIVYANISFIRYVSGIWYIILFLGLLLFSFLFLLLFTTIFPILSRFDNTIIKTIENSLRIFLINPFKSILLLLITYIPIMVLFISPTTMLTMIYLSTYGGFAFIAWLKSHVIQSIFNHLEILAIED